MHFLFMRHAETEANAKGVCAGPHNLTPLTETGRIQAVQSTRILNNYPEKIDSICCSSTLRAIDTAKIICTQLSSPLNIKCFDGLCERDYGAWEEMSFDDLHSRIQNGEIGPNGETRHDFHSRITIALTELDAIFKDQMPLIISHGGVWQGIYDICHTEAPWLNNADIYEVKLDLTEKTIDQQLLTL